MSRLRRRWGCVPVAFAFLAFAGTALGQSEKTLQLTLEVARISNEPGPVQPGRLDTKLREQFRYQSLEVIESRTFELEIDDVARVRLPNGSWVQVKPLLLDERGALLAVDVEGALKTDVRVKSNHMLVLGAHRHGNGRLVISLEPRF